LVLKGLARDNPHCPKQACPITPEILLSFHQLLELNNAYDLYVGTGVRSIILRYARTEHNRDPGIAATGIFNFLSPY
jgi:hypothetical protein